MSRYVCIHGHFYQPPRENAWLEEVEQQDSAYPYHDWNERITAECYAPNATSRILGPDRRIIDIVNNYSRISFNFGPTLLSWLERHNPELHEALIRADIESRSIFSGHGSAMAQVYNHLIMPLANSRDKRTQVLWGIRDFEFRFQRKPAGMWLSETAVDLETLDLLAEHDVKFTILAPRQAGRIRGLTARRWKDVRDSQVDPRLPYLCRLPSGRSITLFFYDGPIARDIAFGGLLSSGEDFAGRLLGAFVEDREEPQIVHIATDGETYGHHHRFGDMALAYCLYEIDRNESAQKTIYPEFLALHPATHEVEIIENTSWSCVHGIERWRADCGCNSGRQGWNQQWRGPLREALDWLRDSLVPVFETEMAAFSPDPWRARNNYIDVILDRSPENVERFFSAHTPHASERDRKVRVLRLLEMQRQAMLMYTSCGWFFDEISGIETTQVLQYAARAIQLAREAAGASLEPQFLEILAGAKSNIPEHQDGARVYERFVKPSIVDLLRVGAHYAVSSIFEDYGDIERIYSYTAVRREAEFRHAGRQRLAFGRAALRSNVTWDEKDISFAVVHLGDHNLICGVREFAGEEAYAAMTEEIREAFARSEIPEIFRAAEKNFQSHNYSLWHLFRDEQRRVFDRILESTLNEVALSFRQVYEHNYSIMQIMREIGTPIPTPLMTTAEFTLNSELKAALAREPMDLDALRSRVEEIGRWSIVVDRATIGFVATRRIDELMEQAANGPEDLTLLGTVGEILRILSPLSPDLNLWKAQNLHFSITQQIYQSLLERAEAGDERARQWLEYLEKLGEHLQIGMP